MFGRGSGHVQAVGWIRSEFNQSSLTAWSRETTGLDPSPCHIGTWPIFPPSHQEAMCLLEQHQDRGLERRHCKLSKVRMVLLAI